MFGKWKTGAEFGMFSPFRPAIKLLSRFLSMDLRGETITRRVTEIPGFSTRAVVTSRLEITPNFPARPVSVSRKARLMFSSFTREKIRKGRVIKAFFHV